MTALMKCGCRANSVDGDGNPVCAICIGIKDGADVIADPPDLTGRMARCICKAERPSDIRLAFFEHRSAQIYDHFYCGCRGWD